LAENLAGTNIARLNGAMPALDADPNVRFGVVISTGRRNTYLGMRAWSEGHEEEVSSSWVYRGAERGALGALEEG